MTVRIASRTIRLFPGPLVLCFPYCVRIWTHDSADDDKPTNERPSFASGRMRHGFRFSGER
jgi:hypothetical protein